MMTCSIRSERFDPLRRVVPVVLAAGLALTLMGCMTTQPTETTGSLGITAPGDGSGEGRIDKVSQVFIRAWAARAAVDHAACRL